MHRYALYAHTSTYMHKHQGGDKVCLELRNHGSHDTTSRRWKTPPRANSLPIGYHCVFKIRAVSSSLQMAATHPKTILKSDLWLFRFSWFFFGLSKWLVGIFILCFASIFLSFDARAVLFLSKVNTFILQVHIERMIAKAFVSAIPQTKIKKLSVHHWWTKPQKLMQASRWAFL